MNPWLERARARLLPVAARLRVLAARLGSDLARLSRPVAARALALVRRRGPWFAFFVSLGVAAGLVGATVATYTAVELHRFERAEARRAVLIYAAGQELAPGVNVRAVDLAGTLARLKYAESRAAPVAPGQYRRTPTTWEIWARRVDDGSASTSTTTASPASPATASRRPPSPSTPRS